MIIRPAQKEDAAGVAGVLHDLVIAGKRSKRHDLEFALAHYITHLNKIECHVAESEDGRILGFQSIKLAKSGNEYGAAAGWALIGTHITPKAARRGIGKALFAFTLRAARKAHVPAIEAFIGQSNLAGQAYYDALGFVDYRRTEDAICKSFNL